MKQHSIQLTLAALLLVVALPAHAQFYAGASVGRSDISIDRDKIADPFLDLGFNSSTTSSSENDTGYRAFAGYQFIPYLGIEAAYVDLGSFKFRTDVDPAGSLTGKPKINGGELSLVGRFPIGESFAVYGRAGVFFARTKTNYSADGSVELVTGAEHQDKSSTKPAYAVGASYAFTPHIGMRAEWARYMDLGDELTGGRTDANLVSLGLTYTF